MEFMVSSMIGLGILVLVLMGAALSSPSPKLPVKSAARLPRNQKSWPQADRAAPAPRPVPRTSAPSRAAIDESRRAADRLSSDLLGPRPMHH
jgi:hypothetical protein